MSAGRGKITVRHKSGCPCGVYLDGTRVRGVDSIEVSPVGPRDPLKVTIVFCPDVFEFEPETPSGT